MYNSATAVPFYLIISNDISSCDAGLNLHNIEILNTSWTYIISQF